MSAKILIDSSGSEEGRGSDKVTSSAGTAILHPLPDPKMHKSPILDGGEGFTKALVQVTGGTFHAVKVTGPLGREVEAHFGFLGGTGPKTAVLEMAADVGMKLIPPDARDLLKTTTYGVGELISAALDAGADRLVIGCGDSCTTDGGAGMAQALGIDLLDAGGRQISWGGQALAKLARIDMSKLDARVHKVKIDVACNWNSVLCGPRGISKIFGPQNGIPPEAVQLLTAALENYADVIQRDLGIDVRRMPGSGAGGGLGAALRVFLKATLRSGYDVVKQYAEIHPSLQKAVLEMSAGQTTTAAHPGINILIAPSGFKESLGPEEVADCIAAGILHVMPQATVHKAPLVDGGEGFAKALVRVTNGTLHAVKVTGPAGEDVEAHYGFLGGESPKTAVLEIASAAGLRLVPRDARDPLKTTTYGVGMLIKKALDAGAQRILIGSGDSGTSDGGAGIAQALGVRLLDEAGVEIGPGADELLKLDRIDMSCRDPRIAQVQIDVACNFHHILCGPNGAARVFGPQKGASPGVVERLVAALDRYADVIERDLGINVRTMPGGGGSGGGVAGLHAFLNAMAHPCYKIVSEYLKVDWPIREADLVVTAEGCIDGQTPEGKIPTEIARLAKSYNLPVVAITGMIGKDAEQNLLHGIDSFVSIMESPTTLPDALNNAPELLTRAAERVMRLILVGHRLGKSHAEEQSLTAEQNLQLFEKLRNLQFAMDSSNCVSSEFVKTMTRELRTPLNLIMGYAAMLKDRVLGAINPDQEKALDHLMKHSLAFFNMINAILLQLNPVDLHLTRFEDEPSTTPRKDTSITPQKG